ncbi:MAG TPA: UbiA family prenyltransferase [Lacisediminihabitans sp.]|jgi:4-hydroxybenzoate polyprenyltransferase|nr:UbiA family prenyltransferase [Lacisediminihabitans sp.]HXD60831.1 UbiA family prenyltransferase [Lacisediminihabitans sp.]
MTTNSTQDAAPRYRIVSLLLSTHPGPAVAVTVVAVVLGIAVGLEPWRIAVLGLAVLSNQFSVGLSNDWLDAERDAAVGRPDKPVARGWVTAHAVRAAAFATAAAAIVLTLPLGLPATLAHAVFILSAWAYNLGLKGTALSVLPYILSFALLPLIATLALPTPAMAAGWAMALGALLGVAAHFANVLPDLDDDRATGVRGLPHRLGGRASGIMTYLVLAAASVVALLGPGGQIDWLRLIGLALGLAIAAAGITLVFTRPLGRLHFQLIIAAALLNVLQLALAGQHLLA